MQNQYQIHKKITLQKPQQYQITESIVKYLICLIDLNQNQKISQIYPKINNLSVINQYSLYQSVISEWYNQESLINTQYLYQSFSEELAYKICVDGFQPQLCNIDKEILRVCLLSESNFVFVSQNLLYYHTVRYLIKQIIKLKSNFLSKRILKNQQICRFVNQCFQVNLQLYTIMHDIVLRSKIDTSIEKNASAAITLLNLASQIFSGMNLSGISIPYADLTGGFFENTNFEKSNLQYVVFDRSYCVGTNFSKCKMLKVNFGLTSMNFKTFVNCIDINNTEKYLAAGGQNSKISVYELKNFQKIKQWFFDKGSINTIKFSYDTNELLTGSYGFIHLWSLQTANCILIILGHTSYVYSAIFSPDDQTIASAGADRRIKLWDTKTGQNIKILEEHEGSIYQICYSRDGKTLVSAGWDFSIQQWDIQSGKKLMVITEHKNSVLCICYSLDGKKIASGSADYTIKLWERQPQLSLLANIEPKNIGTITSLCFSSHSRKLLAGSSDNTIRIFNYQTLREQRIFLGHNNKVVKVIWYNQDKKILSCSRDGTIKLWDAQMRGNLKKTNKYLTKQYLICYSVNKKIILVYTDGKIRVWDVQKIKKIAQIQQFDLRSIDFFLDDKVIMAQNILGIIKLWDSNTFHFINHYPKQQFTYRFKFQSYSYVNIVIEEFFKMTQFKVKEDLTLSRLYIKNVQFNDVIADLVTIKRLQQSTWIEQQEDE